MPVRSSTTSTIQADSVLGTMMTLAAVFRSGDTRDRKRCSQVVDRDRIDHPMIGEKESSSHGLIDMMVSTQLGPHGRFRGQSDRVCYFGRGRYHIMFRRRFRLILMYGGA